MSLDRFACWMSLAGGFTALVLLIILPTRMFSSIEAAVRAFAHKQKLLLILIPVLSLLLNIGIAEKEGLPRPLVQDEFSYLLAGDTFAHGRVTNPTPLFWEHFETPHELMQPSYMSKYPPGQGLALALGQVVTGKPIVGVWLVTAAACGMIYWMLLGFTSPTAAMLGGFLSIVHPRMLDWSESYWGGSVAALGGAMVLGAWVRLMSRPTIGPSFAMGIGLAILANSRPYEGFVLSACLVSILAWRLFRDGKIKLSLIPVAIPLLVMLLPTAAAMGYYNFRITGHPLRMPFQEYARQYDIYPKFWFLPKNPPPVYRNDSMRIIHTDFEKGDYAELRTPAGLLKISFLRLLVLIDMHTHPWILLLPLLVALTAWRDRIIRWVWLTVLVFLIGLNAEDFLLEHYAAPVTAAMFLLIVVGWSRLSHWTRRGRAPGRILAAAVGIGYFFGTLSSVIAPVKFITNRTGRPALIAQATVLQNGRHLIFVRFGPGHLMHDEWVYNDANLDTSRIIWARFMDRVADAPVAQHYSDRRVWLITVGAGELTLNAYDPQTR